MYEFQMTRQMCDESNYYRFFSRRSEIVLWLFIFCCCIGLSSLDKPGPTVKISEGFVKGKYITVPDGLTIAAFLGIPYAEPPVGDLRFKDPVKVSKFKSVLDTTKFGPLCPQEKEFQVVDIEETKDTRQEILVIRTVSEYPVHEDCLTLNVFTPHIHEPDGSYGTLGIDGKLKPVMFYIHGGSYFTNGGRLYPGHKLASHGVVVVTINYRLGPLGFLSTGDGAATGNYGMLDQLEAMEWVRRNIASFGGDPGRVTLFGNSAGGSSVALHLLSPRSKGLFSSAISQSGSALASWATQRHPNDKANDLAEEFDCAQNDNQALVDCLRNIPADELIENAVIGYGFYINFAPIVDSFRGEDSFLPAYPEEILKDGDINEVPFIMGITTDEITHWFQNFTEPIPDDKIQDFITLYTQHLVDKIDTENGEDLINGAIIKQLVLREYNSSYYNNEKMIYDEEDDKTTWNIKLTASIMSDMELKAPSVKFTEMYSARSKQFPVYFYEFGYMSPDDLKSKYKRWMGAYHESELQFIFGLPYLRLNNTLSGDSDKNVSDLMVKLWTNFATYRDPAPAQNTAFDIKWLPFESDGHKYFLYINKSGAFIKENFLTRKMSFWNSFIPLLSEKPIKVQELLTEEFIDGLHRYRIPFYTILFLCFSLLITSIILTSLILKQRKTIKLHRLNGSTNITRTTLASHT